MPRVQTLPELHKSDRINWLRAAVLGANDGIISTASLIVGVAAAQASHHNIIVTGIAGLAAGALSMASGEYVSVSSQSDTEKADLSREKAELASDYDFELSELAQIYEKRGVEKSVAEKVAEQLMAHDALGAHARDELGITEIHSAKPLQAALTSGGSFSLGAALPLTIALLVPQKFVVLSVSSASLIFLFFLGVLSASAGGANIWKGAVRVGFWGALAMAITAAIGKLSG